MAGGVEKLSILNTPWGNRLRGAQGRWVSESYARGVAGDAVINAAIDGLGQALIAAAAQSVGGVKPPTIEQSIPIGLGMTLEFQGLNSALLTIAKLDKLSQTWVSLASYPGVQQKMQTIYRRLVDKCKDIAATVMDEMIYKPGASKGQASLVGGFQRISAKAKRKALADPLRTETGYSTEAMKYQHTAFKRLTGSSRWQKINPRTGESTAFGWGGVSSKKVGLSGLSKLEGQWGSEPFGYQPPTGLLSRAFMAGIKSLAGQGVLIAVDEAVMGAPVYWQHVEYGHHIVIPVRKKKGGYRKKDTGRRVEGRPFYATTLARIQQYMDNEFMPRMSAMTGVLADGVVRILMFDSVWDVQAREKAQVGDIQAKLRDAGLIGTYGVRREEEYDPYALIEQRGMPTHVETGFVGRIKHRAIPREQAEAERLRILLGED